MGQHVDEIADLDLALGLIIHAGLWLADVRIVLLEHEFIVDGVLKCICEKTTVAAPGGVIAIEDLLGRKLDGLSCLEEHISLNSIDRGMSP